MTTAGDDKVAIRHGALCIDIPATWADESSLLFVAPRQKSLLPSLNRVQEPTEAVALRLVKCAADDTAQSIIERQNRELAKGDVGFELIDSGVFNCGLGQGWQQQHHLQVGEHRVRQLSVACIVGPFAVMASATAVEGRFAKCRAELTAVLESLRFADP